jgi:hypothetical protein
MQNVTKNFNPITGAALIPSAFKIKGLEIENHQGLKLDIQTQVTEFEIKESLYSSFLQLRISISDENSILESLPLIGQEKIHLKLFRKTSDPIISDEEISLIFYVTEYPVFIKSDVHEKFSMYDIVGITKHGYINKLNNISRSVSGLTTTEISKIYKQDLAVEDFQTIGECISNFKGIINWKTPIAAANWLLAKSFDAELRPFFCWQNISGKINLASLTKLFEEEPYFTYKKLTIFKTAPGEEGHYLETQSRILEIDSDLRFAKPILAMSGAYASEHNFYDYSKKKFVRKKFNYDELGQGLEANKTLSTSNDVLLNSFPHAYRQWISLNDLAYSPLPKKNINHLKFDSKGKTKAYLENLETTTHTLRLYGDMNLSPGTIINLQFPKAEDLSKSGTDEAIDELISGKYIITSATHQFKDGEYYVWVKVKRDSQLLAI